MIQKTSHSSKQVENYPGEVMTCSAKKPKAVSYIAKLCDHSRTLILPCANLVNFPNVKQISEWKVAYRTKAATAAIAPPRPTAPVAKAAAAPL